MGSPSLTPAEIRQFGECVCFNVRWFSRVLTQHYQKRLGGDGLRYGHTPILARLAAAPAKMAELSSWLALERTALLRTIQPLLDAGYISSHAARAGRGLELSITPAGLKRLGELRPQWEKVQADLVNVFGPERWQEFVAAMERVATHLGRDASGSEV